MAGDPPGSATLTLGADGAGLPAATELAGLLPRVPVARVRFAADADFSTLSDQAVVRTIAVLRECSSIGVQVDWSLILDAEQSGLIERLDHLPAPGRITVRDNAAAPTGAWRSTDHFGLLYFRKGPGFLSVVDQRPESTRRVVVDDPALMDVFSRALAGCAWSEVTQDARHAGAARDLVDKGLLLRVGEHCVTLPVHMRTWPLGAALLGGTLAAAGKKLEEGT
ncbi:DUF5825 family protein [Actinomycetota bacterium Odt1-20B]